MQPKGGGQSPEICLFWFLASLNHTLNNIFNCRIYSFIAFMKVQSIYEELTSHRLIMQRDPGTDISVNTDFHSVVLPLGHSR